MSDVVPAQTSALSFSSRPTTLAKNMRSAAFLLAAGCLIASAECFAPAAPARRTTAPRHHHRAAARPRRTTALRMGLFDALASAFSNEDFQSEDRRVRASHILVASELQARSERRGGARE